jgi:hypothetical protein
MPNAAASISGLFQILSDFSSLNKQAVVATVCLENTTGNNTCNMSANMFVSNDDGSRVGFADQYAFITGAVALCHDKDANTLSFNIRGALINTITMLTPSDSETAIDDSIRPAVVHTISAYHFAMHSWHCHCD